MTVPAILRTSRLSDLVEWATVPCGTLDRLSNVWDIEHSVDTLRDACWSETFTRQFMCLLSRSQGMFYQSLPWSWQTHATSPGVKLAGYLNIKGCQTVLGVARYMKVWHNNQINLSPSPQLYHQTAKVMQTWVTTVTRSKECQFYQAQSVNYLPCYAFNVCWKVDGTINVSVAQNLTCTRYPMTLSDCVRKVKCCISLIIGERCLIQLVSEEHQCAVVASRILVWSLTMCKDIIYW